MTNPTIPVPLPTTGTETLNGTAPAAASVELLQRMVLGAHDTLDRLAESAAPQLQRLEAGLTGAPPRWARPHRSRPASRRAAIPTLKMPTAQGWAAGPGARRRHPA
jgi:hypothetical protein